VLRDLGWSTKRFLRLTIREFLPPRWLRSVAAHAASVLARALDGARSLLTAALLAGCITYLVVGVPASRSATQQPSVFAEREVPGLRSATSSTFVQADGSYKTSISAVPIHYRDGRGHWRDIDSSLVTSSATGYGWASAANSFHVDFANSADSGLVAFDSGAGARFTLALDGAQAAAAAKSGSDGIQFKNVLSAVDLDYRLLPEGLKENLVLNNATAPASYRFTLRVTQGAERLKALAQPDGSVAFSLGEGGASVFSIAAPSVSESLLLPQLTTNPLGPQDPILVPGGAIPADGKATLGVTRVSADTFAVTVRIDPTWLSDPKRVFPVVVDPTITGQADIQDGYYNTSSGTNLPNVSTAEMPIGPNGSTYAGAVKFDLASLPPAAKVTSAKLNLNFSSCIATCGWQWPGTHTDLTLTRLTSGWTSTTPWSGITKEGSATATTSFDVWWAAQQPGAWEVFQSPTLASRVQSMLNGTLANYGFLIEAAGTAQNYATSRFSDVSRSPRLDVEWVSDGVQLATPMHVHSNGPELFWQHYSGGLGPYASAVLADTPQNYWRLDDPPASPFGVADWSGNGLHASTTGTVALQQPGATADGDQSMYFDGTSGHVDTPNIGISDTFSFEAWFKQSQSGAHNYTIASHGPCYSGPPGGFDIFITSDGKVQLDHAEVSRIAQTTGVNVSDGQWHQTVVTKNGGAIHIYVDGVDRTDTASISNTTLGNCFGGMAIGDEPYFNGQWTSKDYFSGSIDDVSLWSSVLSATQVQAHYSAGGQTIAAFDRYEIHRSTTAGFTPSPSTLIATIKDAAIQSYRDTTAKPSTTFYYKVVTYTNGGANSYTSDEVSTTTPAAGQATVTIQPGVAGGSAKATSLVSSNSCANQGASQSLPVDAADRGIVQFDLRQIPNGATVSAATLKLFTFSTPAATIEAHRMTADWTEGTAASAACDSSGASWANRNPSVAWATAGGDYDATAVTASDPGGNPHWDSWTLTSIVQGWLNGSNANLGVLFKHATESGAPSVVYVSNDYTTSLALRPQLVVTYTDNSAANGPSVGVNIPGVSALPGVTASVMGTVTVNAGASDDGHVTSVQLQLDGSNLGSAMTTAPYSYSWNSASVSRGNHTLTAIATDDAGNQTTSAGLTVNVANSAAPTTAISSVSASYRDIVMADNPRSYWRLGDSSGTAAYDQKGVANGTYQGGITLGVTGALTNDANTAVNLDGVDDDISMANPNFNGAFTIESWAYLTGQGSTGGTQYGTIAGYNGTHRILWDATTGGGNSGKLLAQFDGNFFSTNAVSLNAWHHIVYTFDGSTERFYVDGVANGSHATTLPVWNQAFYFGAYDRANYMFKGKLDEAAVYSGALSATQVTTHYNAQNAGAGSGSASYRDTVVSDTPRSYWRLGEGSGTSATDQRGVAAGTYENGITLAASGALTNDPDTAVNLDGINDDVSIPNPNISGPFSIELWAYMTGPGSTGATGYDTLAGYDFTHRILWDSSGGKLLAQFDGNFFSTNTVSLNAWHHIVYTFDGSTERFYVDGVANGSHTTTLPVWNQAFFLGTYDHNDYLFKGKLDEAALYTSALTAAQITAHYNARANPPSSGISGNATVTATASDDVAVSRVDFLIDGNRFASTTSSPYTATLNTLSVYDGSHTVTSKAYDADGNSTSSASYPITVANTSGSKYKATISTSSFVPREMRYDPNAGSQDSAPITVALTNTSTLSWPAASIKLRYRWLNPDGSEFSNSGDISIGTDLTAGGNRNVAVTVQPPTLPGWLMRGRFTLRVDLYDTSCSCYFASKGNQPLEQTATVTRVQPDELGLERYQQYDGTSLGDGLTSSVNLFNGNQAVQWTPYSEPGLGINNVLSLTYSSLENGSASPLGNNWSLSLSGLIPFGLPLDIHPNAADTAAGRTTKWIGFTDADGSYHRFTGNTAGSYYAPPAGVHLYLKVNTGDGQRYYGLIKPDRTAFYFDSSGYPTRVEDADGNALVYTETAVAAGDDVNGLSKQITVATDQNGRTFTFTYFTKSNTPVAALRGKVKSVTDHIGRQLQFAYYDDGNLLRITEKGGQNADGSYLPDRSYVLTYTTPSGSGPAIPGATSARLNPDPASSESTKLYSVIDFRGNETIWTYATSGSTQWRVSSVSNRAGEQTSYAYNTSTATTTVTKPLSRISSYTFDANGRPTSIVDPLNETFNVAWAGDNMPQTITNAATGKYLEFAYNANGQLTDKWDELRDHTTIAYQNLTVDSNDINSNWETGRTIGHLSRPTSIVQPVGNATTSNPTDYTTSFDYTNTSTDHVWHVTDPLGNATTNTYNANGTLATQNLPANGDGITRTTTYNSYDNNGLATKVTDAAGGISQAGYDAAGNLLWTQDPNHGSLTGGDPSQYRRYSSYDSYGRPSRTSTPKSTTYRPGLLTWADSTYDANDNPSSQLSPHFGIGDSATAPTTSTTYDAMDRPLVVTGPRGAADGGPVRTQTDYDAAGRPYQVTKPNGVNDTGIVNLGMSKTMYDALDRLTQTIQYAVTAGAIDTARTRTTNYCYDVAGDLRSVTGPKGAASFTSCPSATAQPYVYTAALYTTKFAYDAAHRKTTTINPSGTTVLQTAYNENGAVNQATDANNKITTYSYSDRGEKTKEVDPFDSAAARTTTQKWTYDNLGDLASYISPRAYDDANGGPTFTNYVTSYSYDALRRLNRTTLPTDASTAVAYTYTSYDANGNKTMVSLPSTQTSATNLSATEKTTVSYWDSGNIYGQTNPSTPTTRFDYTAEGWQATRTPELATQSGALDYSRAMYWDYYADGLLKSVRDQGGERAYYSYDADGNQTGATEADGITQANQTTLTIQRTYDDLDQLNKVRTPKPSSSNWLATTYAYDLHGLTNQLADNLEETTAGSQVTPGRVYTFTFNSLDQPITQTDDFATAGTTSDDEQVTYSYTPTGLLDTRTLSKNNGAGWTQEQKVSRSYYDNGLLKQLTNYDGTNAIIEQHTLAYTSGGGSGVYNNGNKTSDTFKLKNADGGSTCWTATCTASWTYNARDQLTQAADGTGTTTTYTLDAEGNITQQSNGTSTTTNTYNGQQLTTTTTGVITTRYIYDSNGNTDCTVDSNWSAATCPTAANTSLLTDNVYDYENRLANYRAYSSGTPTDTTDYTNDPLDRPVGETETHSGVTTTTTLRYLGDTNAVSREDLTGATNSTKTYSYDASGLRLTVANTPQGSGTSRYSYLNDDHGSVSLLVDQASTVELSYGYGAYGASNSALTKTAAGFNANTNPYRYSSKRWDSGSNNYDMGARRYSPAAGRFLQEDLYSGAFADLGLAANPLTENRYLFTGANPVNYVELDGHRVAEDDDETCDPISGSGCLASGDGGGGGTGGTTDTSGGGGGRGDSVNPDGLAAADAATRDDCTAVPDELKVVIAGFVDASYFNFHASCRAHDVCYGQWATYRKDCDESFFAFMKKQCHQQHDAGDGFGLDVCIEVARLYHLGVQQLGGLSWVMKAYKYDARGTTGCPWKRQTQRCLAFVQSRSYPPYMPNEKSVLSELVHLARERLQALLGTGPGPGCNSLKGCGWPF
jgi:RHS repeat-associated protein